MYNLFQVKRKGKPTTTSQSNPTTKIKLHIQVEELTTNMVHNISDYLYLQLPTTYKDYCSQRTYF